MTADAAQDDSEFIDQDFVYAGRRTIGDKLFAEVHRIGSDGKLQNNPALYGYTPKDWKRFSVGGVYRGAKFSATKVRGFNVAKWVNLWPVQADRMQWQAEAQEADAKLRTQKLEADAGKMDEIATLLLPLRIQYAALYKRYDRPAMVALENAVLRSLREKPRVREQGDE